MSPRLASRCFRLLHLVVTLSPLLALAGPVPVPPRALAAAPDAAAGPARAGGPSVRSHGLPLTLPAALARRGVIVTAESGEHVGARSPRPVYRWEDPVPIAMGGPTTKTRSPLLHKGTGCKPGRTDVACSRYRPGETRGCKPLW